MTIYEDRENSDYLGAPVEGYEFVGSFATYRYTSTERDVTINGQLYTAAPGVRRGALKAGTQADDNFDLEVVIPNDLQLATDYAYSVSPPSLTLTIYRYHEGTNPASDWIILWKGKVAAFSTSGKETKLRVPSLFAVFLRGEVPNRYYHGPCNHVLYDARCKVVDTTFKTTTTVASLVSATSLTVVNDGFADGFLVAGEIVRLSTGERRAIVSNVANLITYVFPFHQIASGNSVELRAGCLHSLTECKNKFNNVPNYGGFPYIPSENPFKGQL